MYAYLNIVRNNHIWSGSYNNYKIAASYISMTKFCSSFVSIVWPNKDIEPCTRQLLFFRISVMHDVTVTWNLLISCWWCHRSMVHCNSSFIMHAWIQFFQFTTWWQTYWTSSTSRKNTVSTCNIDLYWPLQNVAQSPVFSGISGEPRRRKMVRPVPGLCVWWAISFLCLSLVLDF